MDVGSAADRKSDGEATQPQLMYLLKASVKNLGMNRAALQRSGEGSGRGEGAIHRNAAVCGVEETSEEAIDFAHRQNVDGRPPKTVERSMERAELSERPTGDIGSSLSDKENAAAGRGMSPAVTATAGEAASREDRSEKDLHELFSARAEPMLLPLYPPGDPFLMCNLSKVKLDKPTSSSRADGTAAREAGMGEPAKEIEDVSTSLKEQVVHSNKRNSAAMGIEDAVSTVDKRVGVGVGNVGKTENVDSSGNNGSTTRVPAGGVLLPRATATTVDIEAEKMTQGDTSEEMPYARRSKNVVIEDCRAGGSGVEDTDGIAAGGASGDSCGPAEIGEDLRSEDRDDRKEILVVRVPHQHFLRMPVSPSMIEDHFISSYRHGLAGVKRGGMAMMQQVPHLPTSIGGQ